jgi:hypothetical protein
MVHLPTPGRQEETAQVQQAGKWRPVWLPLLAAHDRV